MAGAEELEHVIEETCRLLRRNNGNKKGTVSLSPEVARLLDGITSRKTVETAAAAPIETKPTKVGKWPLAGKSAQCCQ